MAALGFFTGDNSPDSYETLQRRRRMADALLAQSQDGAPIQSWTQGGAKLVQALSGSLMNNQLDKKEKASGEAFNKLAMSLLGGSPQAAAPAMGGAPSPGPSAASAAAPRLPAMAQGGAAPNMTLPDAAKNAGLSERILPALAEFRSSFPDIVQTSGFRDPARNAAVGGAKGSAHMSGDALDFSVRGLSEDQKRAVVDWWRQRGATGIGYYPGSDSIHVDMRPGPNRAWGPNFSNSSLGQTPDWFRSLAQEHLAGSNAQMANVGAGSPMRGMMAFAGHTSPQNDRLTPQQNLQPGNPTPAAPPQPAQGQRLAQAMTSPPIPAPQPTGNVQAAMMAVLTDPRFSPQQKQQAMQLFQMGQAKADFDFQVAGDQLYRINKRTGQAEPVPGASAAKPSDVQKQFEQAKREGFQGNLFDYQKALAAARRPEQNVTVNNKGDNKFDDTIGTETAKLFMETAKEGAAARADVGRVRQLRSLVETLPGGFIGGAEALASRYGIKLGPNASKIEAAEAIINQLVPAQRPPGSGTMSDRDVDLFKSSLPSLSNTPQGNKIILDTMEAMAQYKAAQAAIATEVVTKRITRDEGLRKLQELPDPFEMFKGFAGSQPLAPAPMRQAPASNTFSDDEIQAEMKHRGLL
jgi:hypothetical protein